VVITEEFSTGFGVECDCGAQLYPLKAHGVIDCPNCGRHEDPRHLRRKWDRNNQPELAEQALFV